MELMRGGPFELSFLLFTARKTRLPRSIQLPGRLPSHPAFAAGPRAGQVTNLTLSKRDDRLRMNHQRAGRHNRHTEALKVGGLSRAISYQKKPSLFLRAFVPSC
jgi:hypothetical protein